MKDEIKIYFGGELSNLFELGYISTDLHQVIAFCSLLEADDIEQAEKYFGDKSRPLNRYVTISESAKRKSAITDVKKGSIELTLAGIGVVGTYIMPLVAERVNKYFEERDEVVQFQISAKDENLSRILRNYEKGQYGNNQEGLDRLMAYLKQADYDVSIISDNTYLVEHVIEKYSQRIIRTIKKNR